MKHLELEDCREVLSKFFTLAKNNREIIESAEYSKYFVHGVLHPMSRRGDVWLFADFVHAHKLQDKTIEEIAILFNLIGAEYD